MPYAQCTRLLVTLALVSFVFGCAHGTPVNAPPAKQQPLYDPGPLTEYRMAPSDNISIKYYGNEELDTTQPIRPDGMVSLAFVGQVKAAGLTPAELEDRLTELYTGELAAPRINVIVNTVVPQVFYAGGEVGSRGVHTIHGEINVLQAIQMAGGTSPEARPGQVVLIRADADGRAVGRTFDLKKMQSGSPNAYNTIVRAHDVLFVPRSRIRNFATWVDNYIGGLIPDLPGFGFVVNDAVND